MTIKNILPLAFLFSLSACNRSNLTYNKPHFDFDSLVTHQLKWLSPLGDSIKKIAVMDGKQDASAFQATEEALRHELDIFQQLDVINKPIFKKAFLISAEEDTKSNLKVRLYQFNQQSNIKSPVDFVRFYYLNDIHHLKKIESVYQEENALYFTKRNLTVEFEEKADRSMLKRYSISGVQKMILNDSVKFTISGTIF